MSGPHFYTVQYPGTLAQKMPCFDIMTTNVNVPRNIFTIAFSNIYRIQWVHCKQKVLLHCPSVWLLGVLIGPVNPDWHPSSHRRNGDHRVGDNRKCSDVPGAPCLESLLPFMYPSNLQQNFTRNLSIVKKSPRRGNS